MGQSSVSTRFEMRRSMSIGTFLIVALALLWSASPSWAQAGKLKVKATPTQAYVFVDGKAVWEASKAGVSLSPGEHTVDVYNYGYKPATRKVTVAAGKTETLEVKLDSVPGDVTGPWGCITIEKANRDAILLNGKTPEFFVGHGDEFNHNWWWKQELVVPAGPHQLTVFSGDKEVWSGSVNVAANQRLVIDIPKGVRKTVPWPRGEQFKTFARFKAGTASATVAVAKPTAQLTADKSQINCGETAQLKWSTTEAPATQISELGKVAASGEKSVQPLHNTAYNLTATGPGGTATASAAVAVNTAIQAALDLSPREVRYRRVGTQVLEKSTANLKWSTSNASKIDIDPLGQVGATGSRSLEVTPRKTSQGPIDETVTYTLTAGNIAGTKETRTATLHVIGSIEPAEAPKKAVVEVHVPLYSVYFPTALPAADKPEGGLMESQQQTLTALAADFKKLLEQKPDARLMLTGHADRRGSAESNQALSERRVNRIKQALVDNGIPAASIDLRGVGSQDELSADQVKQLVEQQSKLTEAEQKKILKNLPKIVLAQNRRVDISLSSTGEQSVRQYPFNADDASILLDTKKPSGRAVKKAPPAKK
jgi:hypothetical protein